MFYEHDWINDAGELIVRDLESFKSDSTDIHRELVQFDSVGDLVEAHVYEQDTLKEANIKHLHDLEEWRQL
jgi:hypothetical protein